MIRKTWDRRIMVRDVFAPILIPISHGGNYSEYMNVNYGIFPHNFYRVGGDGIKISFSPIQIIYNDTAKVHKRTDFIVLYKTPAEMWIDSEGSTIDIEMKNLQRKSLEGDLFVEVSNGNGVFNQTKKINLRKSVRPYKMEFDFGDLPSGYYRTRVFFFSDDFVIGPRYEYFRIEENEAHFKYRFK
jgi:hypothetical protein